MSQVQKYRLVVAPIAQVWAALTDPAAIAAWMGDDAVLSEARAGGSYACFNRATTGRYTRFEPPHTLECTWRQSSWPPEWPDSRVRWELRTEEDATQIWLIHVNFPNDEEAAGHDEGWDMYWLDPMQEWLETAET